MRWNHSQIVGLRLVLGEYAVGESRRCGSVIEQRWSRSWCWLYLQRAGKLILVYSLAVALRRPSSNLVVVCVANQRHEVSSWKHIETHRHWKITVRIKTLPWTETTIMASQVILLQSRDEVDNILLTNISIDNFVNVQAVAKTICAVRTILSPVVTFSGGISYYWKWDYLIRCRNVTYLVTNPKKFCMG